MEESLPFPYKSKVRVAITLCVLALVVIFSHFGPRLLQTPFGAARQVQVKTETLTYHDDAFSFDYPSAWTARDVSPDPIVQQYLPGISHVAAIGPGTSVEHAIFISSLSPADLEKAIMDREQTSAHDITDRTPVTIPAGPALRLTFVSKTNANEHRTYYILQSQPTTVILLHGPGDKTLDAAGEILLKTFAPKAHS